jgi:hypothetical protein
MVFEEFEVWIGDQTLLEQPAQDFEGEIRVGVVPLSPEMFAPAFELVPGIRHSA